MWTLSPLPKIGIKTWKYSLLRKSSELLTSWKEFFAVKVPSDLLNHIFLLIVFYFLLYSVFLKLSCSLASWSFPLSSWKLSCSVFFVLLHPTSLYHLVPCSHLITPSRTPLIPRVSEKHTEESRSYGRRENPAESVTPIYNVFRSCVAYRFQPCSCISALRSARRTSRSDVKMSG